MVNAVPTTATPENPAGAMTRRGEQVLDELETIILAEGFSSLNVSDIATRLACSKRTLYTLAPSRNELVLTVLRRFFARIRAQADAAAATQDDPPQQVYDYLQVGVRAAQRIGPRTIDDIQSWLPAQEIWRDHISRRVDGLRVLLQRGVAAGAFHGIQPAFVAEIVFAALNRLREPDFYRSTDLSPFEAFEETYRMLLLSLAPGVEVVPASKRGERPSAKRTQH